MDKAEAALKMYDFLKWLDPFVSGAESVSNLDDPIDLDIETQGEENNSQETDYHPEEELSDSEDSDEENVAEGSQSKVEGSQGKVEEGKEVDSKKKKRLPTKLPDEIPPHKKVKVTTDDLLATINKPLHEKKKEKLEKKEREPNDSVGDNDIFGKMVANELRSLPKRKQSKLKHDINNAIFKYQCEVEQEEFYAPTPPTYRQEISGASFSSLINLAAPVIDSRLVSPSGTSTSSYPASPYDAYGSY